MKNVVPCPTLALERAPARRGPRRCSCTIERPRPVPLPSFLVVKNGSKTWRGRARRCRRPSRRRAPAPRARRRRARCRCVTCPPGAGSAWHGVGDQVDEHLVQLRADRVHVRQPVGEAPASPPPRRARTMCSQKTSACLTTSLISDPLVLARRPRVAHEIARQLLDAAAPSTILLALSSRPSRCRARAGARGSRRRR